MLIVNSSIATVQNTDKERSIESCSTYRHFYLVNCGSKLRAVVGVEIILSGFRQINIEDIVAPCLRKEIS